MKKQARTERFSNFTEEIGTVIYTGNKVVVLLETFVGVEDGGKPKIIKGVAKLHPDDIGDDIIGLKIAFLRAKIKLLTRELKFIILSTHKTKTPVKKVTIKVIVAVEKPQSIVNEVANLVLGEEV